MLIAPEMAQVGNLFFVISIYLMKSDAFKIFSDQDDITDSNSLHEEMILENM